MGYHFQLPKWESNDTQPWFRPFWTSPTKYCMSDLIFSHILKAFAASLIDETTWSTLKRKWRNITLDWACHSRLYCRKSQQGNRMVPSHTLRLACGMKQVPLFSCGAMWSKNHHFGDHDFWCRLQAIAQPILHCKNLGSWYWTDWTHNHKTLKEIIESHVCRAHYPSPRIFSTEISWQIFRKAEDPCYAQQRCMGYSCKNHGRRVASGNLIIPKRWSRRLWFATLMTHIERIFFFWNTLKLTEPETWWVGSWKHFIFWGRYNLINSCKLVLVLVG